MFFTAKKEYLCRVIFANSLPLGERQTEYKQKIEIK